MLGFFRNRFYFIIFLAIVALAAFHAAGTHPGRVCDYRWRDVLFWLRGPEKPDPRIILCSLGEDSFESLSSEYPFSAKTYIKFFRNLKKLGVCAVGLDFIISDSYKTEFDTDETELKNVLADLKNVVFAAKFEKYFKNEKLSGREISSLVSIYKTSNRFFSSCGKSGLINASLDYDGVLRAASLVYDVSTGGRSYETFVLKLYETFYESLPPGEAKNYVTTSEIVLKRSRFIINYAGGPQHFNEVPFSSIVKMPEQSVEKLRKKYSGCIFIVGPTFYESHDFFSVPFSNSQYVKGYNLMAGYETMANALNTLMTGKFLQGAPSFVVPAVTAVFSTLCILSFVYFRSIIVSFLVYLAASCCAVFISYRLFIDELKFMNVTQLLFTVFSLFIVSSLIKAFLAESDKRFMRNTLGRYMSSGVVDKILRDGESINFSGESVEATVIFADIRNFTSISEKIPAESVVALLNGFFRRMVDIVFSHEGTLDKFIGDCLMVIFGAPQHLKAPVASAIKCSIAMQKAADEYNMEHSSSGEAEMRMGIGIAYGKCVAGNIGSERRMEYTAIGDVVNVSSRLQSIAGPGEILATMDAIEELKKSDPGYYGQIREKIVEIGPAALKGKEVKVTVFQIRY